MTRLKKLLHYAHREYIKLMMSCGVEALTIWDLP